MLITYNVIKGMPKTQTSQYKTIFLKFCCRTVSMWTTLQPKHMSSNLIGFAKILADNHETWYPSPDLFLPPSLTRTFGCFA